MQPTEEDELVDTFGERGDEEDEGTVGRDTVAVGAVEEVGVDSETHSRRDGGVEMCISRRGSGNTR